MTHAQVPLTPIAEAVMAHFFIRIPLLAWTGPALQNAYFPINMPTSLQKDVNITVQAPPGGLTQQGNVKMIALDWITIRTRAIGFARFVTQLALHVQAQR